MARLISIFIIIFSISIIFIACPPQEECPVETIKWQKDGKGFIQFYTTDLSQSGRHIQCYDPEATLDMNEKRVETIVKKLSGADNRGYGIAFCYHSDDYYQVAITTKGKYQISKSVGGNRSAIVDWNSSGLLKTGDDKENEIEVQWDSTNDIYAVYFNNNLEVTFDGNGKAFALGRSGFYVHVSATEENFPCVPVDVRFKQNRPVAVP